MSDTPKTDPSTERQQSRLVTWLKVNVIAMLGLVIVLGGVIYASGVIIAAVSRWVVSLENTIADGSKELGRSNADIKLLKENVVDIDKRINEERARLVELHDDINRKLSEEHARVIELHTQSDQADAALKTRLDIIDALGKLTADRSFQPALPQPYQKGPPR